MGMRLLRALGHFVLALAFVAVAAAQAQAVICTPIAVPTQQHHGHQATSASVEHDAHDHSDPADPNQTPRRDNCQTVCCFTAGRLPAPAPETSTVQFFGIVRYAIAVEPLSGLAFAPDPGVPKHCF